MQVAVAARSPDKPVLADLQSAHGVHLYACDASEPADVQRLFDDVVRDLGSPRLIVHNIDGRVVGILRKGLAEADPELVLATLRNSPFSAFLVAQQAARRMGDNEPDANGVRGTIIFTNASAALKGFALSAAFAMACQAKAGLAQSMARELMPKGIHVANVPIDAAVGLDPRRRIARAPVRWSRRRGQHGRPGPHRRALPAAPPPASLDVGVRSGAQAVGREVVTPLVKPMRR
jgi:NAD(P)-dependent dehydrogenase (short-subunit alcohol dehydrogenase family)